MDQRFLLLIAQGDGDIGEPCAIARRLTGFTSIWSMPGSVLMMPADGKVITLPNGKGVVIGPLFLRHGWPVPVLELEEAAAETIVATNGEELIARYWGAYLAIWAT